MKNRGTFSLVNRQSNNIGAHVMEKIDSLFSVMNEVTTDGMRSRFARKHFGENEYTS